MARGWSYSLLAVLASAVSGCTPRATHTPAPADDSRIAQAVAQFVMRYANDSLAPGWPGGTLHTVTQYSSLSQAGVTLRAWRAGTDSMLPLVELPPDSAAALRRPVFKGDVWHIIHIHFAVDSVIGHRAYIDLVVRHFCRADYVQLTLSEPAREWRTQFFNRYGLFHGECHLSAP